MNRTVAPDLGRAAPSWSASLANRIDGTESLTQKAFNRLLQQNRHKADVTIARQCLLLGVKQTLKAGAPPTSRRGKKSSGYADSHWTMKRSRKLQPVAINPLVVDLSHHNDVPHFAKM